MKKCVIIPDSFKGSMDSIAICRIIDETILSFYPQCQNLLVPVADGGEGTVECFVQALSAEKIPVEATGPYDEPITVSYARTGDTAIVEMAMCAGLPQVEDRKNPALTTTSGVGLVIKKAVQDGCRKIILGLGGSCTNDGGTGMAHALGVRFYKASGEAFRPTGGTLHLIDKMDASQAESLLRNVEVTAMCDIDNPLYGPTGAAFVFGPQKGADKEQVLLLDEGLQNLARVILKSLGKDVAQLPGSGAAGGMGAGVAAFLNGSLQSGIQTVLNTVGFDELIKDADLIFTGEGKIDGQSLRGKVVIGVAERAKAQGIPVIAIVGDVGDDAEGAYERGVSAIFSINRVAVDFEKARLRSPRDLRSTVEALMRFSKACRRGC